MSVSIMCVHIHAACPCLYCCMSMLHDQVHPTCPIHIGFLCPCCIYIICPCCMHVHVHTACICPCCISTSMLYLYHISMLHACPSACCMLSPTACPYPCCMSTSILQVRSMQHVQSILHVHANAVCPCLCCMSTYMLYVYVHAACPINLVRKSANFLLVRYQQIRD
jgi:hypothetical protein